MAASQETNKTTNALLASSTRASDTARFTVSQTDDKIYLLSLASFKKQKVANWEKHLASLSEGGDPLIYPYYYWLYYAAEINSKAAFEFACVARAIRGLQGPYNNKGEKKDQGLPHNPLEYLEEYQFYIVERWMNTLEDWVQDLRRNRSNYKKCSLAWENLHASLLDIDSSLDRLDKEVFVNNTGEEGSVVDPTVAWRAIHYMVPKLHGIEGKLRECVEDMMAVPEEHLPSADSKESLLRRRQGPNLKAENNKPKGEKLQTSRDVTSPNRLSTGKLLRISNWPRLDPLVNWNNTSPLTRGIWSPRKLIMLAVVNQSTLWTLTLIFTACSGLMIGLAISQSRPPACVPNSTSLSSDDGFWSLLSQLLLQLLSLYSTVIPLLRDGTLPVRRIWFSAAVSVSAIMNILALVLYAISWKGSELLGYISGVSALVAGVQLAGMIEGVMQLPKAKSESE